MVRSLALALAFVAACRSRPAGEDPVATGAPLAAVAPPKAEGRKTVIDFLEDRESCRFGHRGTLLDLGDPAMQARMSGSKLVAADVETREHEGASWVAVRGRSLELSFVSDAEVKPEAGIVIEARMRGGLAKSASVYLNGKPIGQLSLTKGETAIVAARAPATILKGTNEVLFRFNGGPKSSHDQLAELDWVRVGPNDGDVPYAAPTRSDAVTAVSIAGASKRAISLRAPGYARCTTFVPSGAMLEGFIGVSGGEAEAEVRVLVDRAEPRVVGSFRLGGPGDPPGFRPVALPLGDVGTIAAVELVAKTSTKGARVAFAEPRLVLPPAPEKGETAPAVAARGVVMVVLGSVPRRLLSIYGGAVAMPELASLAGEGTVFDAHRATSSFASGALGSMLTGALPREHAASDLDAALSPTIFTLAEAARQAGVVTAMFTANPTTTAPFGFARGWETFTSRLPGAEDVPATAIFEDAGRWLDAHKDDRFLLVVHARGGHPPWDVTSEELKDLPPAGYAGSMEPKHAGEALAKARKAGGARLFADPDRERAFALHEKALVAHDAALGALAARLKATGREKDTVWIVTGDIGLDAAAHVPFLEEESLEEGALAVPLVMRAPKRLRDRVTVPTSGVDVAPTILDALSLPPPRQLRGESLFALAGRARPDPERPLVAATTTRFSARWGAFTVVGAKEREVKVCNLVLDPDCVSDVRPSHPFAAEALHGLAWRELAGKPQAPPRAIADGPTSAALKIWGR